MDCNKFDDEERLHRLEEWDLGRVRLWKADRFLSARSSLFLSSSLTQNRALKIKLFVGTNDVLGEAGTDKNENKMKNGKMTLFFKKGTLHSYPQLRGSQYLCPNCNSFPLEDFVWWVSGGKTHKEVMRILWRKSRAKVFKTHAVLQGLRKLDQCAETAGE